jgi:hypothetical protein
MTSATSKQRRRTRLGIRLRTPDDSFGEVVTQRLNFVNLIFAAQPLPLFTQIRTCRCTSPSVATGRQLKRPHFRKTCYLGCAAAPGSPFGPASPFGPLGPAGPAEPAGPGGPGGPAGPATPGGPCCQAGPCAPVSPFGPGGPAGPSKQPASAKQAASAIAVTIRIRVVPLP